MLTSTAPHLGRYFQVEESNSSFRMSRPWSVMNVACDRTEGTMSSLHSLGKMEKTVLDLHLQPSFPLPLGIKIIRILCSKEVLQVYRRLLKQGSDTVKEGAVHLSLSNGQSKTSNAETRKMKHPLQKRPCPIQYARLGTY